MRFSYLFIVASIIIAIAIGTISFKFFPIFKFEGFDKALEGILLLSSICLGFYGACLSVLASIFNTKIVKEVMEDNNYRKEFILISASSLLTGFFLVMTTIVYQVLLENKNVKFSIMNITNSIWLIFLTVYLCFSVLFILISFMIFFQNKSVTESNEVNSGEINNADF